MPIPQAEPDYGQDLSCKEDLDPLLRTSTGTTLMGEVALRRVYTPLGGLLSAPNALTLDIRELVGEAVRGESDIVTIRARCQAALLDDERIFEATVAGEFDFLTKTLTLTLAGVGSRGPFRLVLAASQVTVDVLESA